MMSPMLRATSLVTVTFAVMFKVSKRATALGPGGTVPFCQLFAVPRWPGDCEIQKPVNAGPPFGSVGTSPVRLNEAVSKPAGKNAAGKVSPLVSVTSGVDCCASQAEVNVVFEFSSRHPFAGREKR